MIDFTSTTDRTSTVIAALRDDQLELPTPANQTVAQVVHHMLGLSVAFRDAAGKVGGPTTSTPPEVEEGPLPDGWRELANTRLAALASAWADEGAWTGMTRAGGVDLPGEVCGLVALDEVLLHGWDLARATGQPYMVSDGEAEAIRPIVTPETPDGAGREGLFGTVVHVPQDAPAFDQVLGLAGRDPNWAPPSSR